MDRSPRRYHVGGALLLVSAAVLSAARAEGGPDARQKGKIMDKREGPITLTLSCDQEYVAGFPLFVSVELHNIATNAFIPFRRFGLFDAPGPVEFVLRGGGREWTWPKETPQLEGEPSYVEFGPGRVWLALQDLSDVHPDIPPGHYELSASAPLWGQVAHSGPISFEIRAPSERDRAAAARLRVANELKSPSWRAFARENWSTPDVSGLSASARTDVPHHLAYYLYLHRVAYGPKPVAALDPQEPWHFGHGVLESEAAVVRLEVLSAAHRPEASGVEKAILERWPGLAWRVEEIHRGAGLLKELRSFWGVEKSGAPPAGPRPYQSR